MIWNPIEILKSQHFPTADNFRRIPIGSDRLRFAWEVNETIEVTASDLHLVCQTLSFVNQEPSELKSWCFLTGGPEKKSQCFFVNIFVFILIFFS